MNFFRDHDYSASDYYVIPMPGWLNTWLDRWSPWRLRDKIELDARYLMMFHNDLTNRERYIEELCERIDQKNKVIVDYSAKNTRLTELTGRHLGLVAGLRSSAMCALTNTKADIDLHFQEVERQIAAECEK